MTSAASVSCVLCGRAPTGGGTAASGPGRPSSPAHTAAGWLREAGPGDTVTWVCPACVRRHLRSIEARLDHDWW